MGIKKTPPADLGPGEELGQNFSVASQAIWGRSV
jgi:hypothetical protein